METPHPGIQPAPSRGRWAPRFAAHLLLAAGASLLLPAHPLCAQEADEFAGRTRVVATDVVVDVLKKETLLTSAKSPQRSLGVEDFEIYLGEEKVPAVGVEAPGPEAEAWSFLVYIDTTLLGDQELRWGAALLMAEVGALAALGPVTLVAADPEPRTALAPTRDAEALQQALAPWVLESEGENTLTRLREAVLDSPEAEGLAPEELVRLETALVRERLDVFLLHLVEDLPVAARRAVFTVGLAFDSHPESFYGAEPDGIPEPLAASTAELAGTVGAYGWTILSLAAPLPENRAKTKSGVRIGKLRFSWGNDLGLPGFSAAYEEDRDREKAKAHYEVGVQEMKAGRPEEAIESFQRAIYHYYGDPRTGKEQIRTYEALGEAFSALGDEESARRAHEAARELAEHPKVKKRELRKATRVGGSRAGGADPPSSPGDGSTPAADESTGLPTPGDASPPRLAGATDIDPTEALAALASATAGFAVRDADGLKESIRSLERRYRLTFPLDSGSLGQLRPLRVEPKDPRFQILAPGHARAGVPEGVIAARLRRLITSDLPNEAGDLDAEEVEPGEGDSLTTARIVVDLSPHSEPGDTLRLSYAQAGADGEVEPSHLLLPPRASAGGTFTLEISRDPDRPGLALILDNLTTGAWATTILEL